MLDLIDLARLFGLVRSAGARRRGRSSYRIRRMMAPQPGPGEVFSGAALEQVGFACPRMHPDHAVLYRADALEVPA
jgi:hypothetical protein